ncbi:hypothetical protein C0989_004451 [Termitomyces sp. Mn162]|nr:hypothetical protein C0989_004451 [Termitomyces sp. Mn162]
MALYREWLERTRGAPLVIIFNGDNAKEFDNALNLFSSHAHQWVDVTIALQPLISAKLIELQPEDVPLLKKVTIDHRYLVPGRPRTVTPANIRKIISTLARIPTLTDLSWGYDSIPLFFYSLKWPNLKKFHAYTCRLKTEECLVLLDQLPQVEDIFFGNYIDGHYKTIVTAKNLHSLVLYCSSGSDMRIFNALTLPSLETLQTCIPRDHTTVEHLIERSGCTLRHLTVNGIHGNLLALLELKCFCSLYSLRFTLLPCLTNEVARRLTWDIDTDQSIMFPHLSSIEISNNCDTTDGILSRMISSRWKGNRDPHGLKRLVVPRRFIKSGIVQDIDRATLRCLSEQGLDIVEIVLQ